MYKMPHPGVTFVVFVGIGLATFLYYMLTDRNSNDNNGYNNNHRGTSDGMPNNAWSTLNSRSRCRRNSDNVDISNCTICLNPMSESSIVKIVPCRHQFHKRCILSWRNQGDMSNHRGCPNCRGAITNLVDAKI